MTASRGPAVRAQTTSAPVPVVLIGDADEDTRSLYRQSLQHAGYAVLEAADGREALVRALTQRPSIVVAELTRPYVDGLSLCEILHRDRHTSSIPLLVATADSRPAQLTRARMAGAHVLVKPVDIDGLLMDIQQLLAPEASSVAAECDHAPAEQTLSHAWHATASTKPLVKSFVSKPPLRPSRRQTPSVPIATRRCDINGVRSVA